MGELQSFSTQSINMLEKTTVADVMEFLINCLSVTSNMAIVVNMKAIVIVHGT